MRGILTADQAAALTLAAKVDAVYGYPRCDRLSGTLTAPAVVLASLTCPCKDPKAPDPSCTFSTRMQFAPIRTNDGWAYPVDPSLKSTIDALSKSEAAAITDVQEKAAVAIDAGGATAEAAPLDAPAEKAAKP